MSKIPQIKFNADLVVPRSEPISKWELKRLDDGLVRTGSKVQYIEWNEVDRSFLNSHDDIQVGRSLMLEPRMQFTWLTSPITQIVEQREGYTKFKTLNSTYELKKI
jgi:hypothetical protein